MIVGIIWALSAGVMLGLYALPEKFTKDFKFENTWGLMFFINLLIVPMIAGFTLVNGFSDVLTSIPRDVLIKMVIASIAWGIGVMMWGKAINHIGLALGFSIFIGTVILVGSFLPFLVDGLPELNAFLTILFGIVIVLVGILANGLAGLTREKDEKGMVLLKSKGASMGKGITIAVVGGLLATGFSYANAVGRPVIHEACQAAGNPEWVTAIAVMFVIYVAGGLFVLPYFIVQLTSKKLWGNFNSPQLMKNLGLTSIMAILNFMASAAFAFAAFKLGKSGNTVGYAIFNTISVAVAIISGLMTKEWVNASSKAKKALYIGLAAMIVGVVIIALGNSFA